jgi:hypothetical protein
MEHLTLPSVGGSCTPILPNFQNEISKKFKKFKKNEQGRTGQASTRGRQATIGRWLALAELTCGQRPQASTAGRLATTSRPQVDAWPIGLCSLFLKFFFLMPSTFCACGQLLLVGSSTCPPWLDPAQNFKHI